MDKLPKSLRQARFVALDLLRNYNILTPPIDLWIILTWEWLRLYEFPFPKEADEIAWMLNIEESIIYVNENDEDYNKPFTVAHELWHWMLHKMFMEKTPEKYSIVFKKKWADENSDVLEREADCFARNLLIPKFMLDSYKGNLKIMELAKLFSISPLLLEKRISQEYE